MEGDWRVCEGSLEGMGRLTGGCVEADWLVCEGSLEGVGRLSGVSV